MTDVPETGLIRRNHGLNHSYRVDGVKCRGVTTILQQMPKAGLIKWAAETTADYSIDHEAELAALPYSKRRKALLGARFDDRDTAANRGTQVHRLGAELSHGRDVGPVPDFLRGHVESYARWLDAEDIDPVATELVIANRAVWYCGSVDLITPYRGATTLIDLSTSRSGVWFEKALQITAYRWAETYSLPTWDGAEKPLADLGIEATGAVHIRADGCDFRPTRSDSDVWDYFRHVAWLHAHDEDTDTWVGVADDPAPQHPPR